MELYRGAGFFHARGRRGTPPAAQPERGDDADGHGNQHIIEFRRHGHDKQAAKHSEQRPHRPADLHEHDPRKRAGKQHQADKYAREVERDIKRASYPQDARVGDEEPGQQEGGNTQPRGEYARARGVRVGPPPRRRQWPRAA